MCVQVLQKDIHIRCYTPLVHRPAQRRPRARHLWRVPGCELPPLCPVLTSYRRVAGLRRVWVCRPLQHLICAHLVRVLLDAGVFQAQTFVRIDDLRLARLTIPGSNVVTRLALVALLLCPSIVAPDKPAAACRHLPSTTPTIVRWCRAVLIFHALSREVRQVPVEIHAKPLWIVLARQKLVSKSTLRAHCADWLCLSARHALGTYLRIKQVILQAVELDVAGVVQDHAVCFIWIQPGAPANDLLE